MNLNNISFKNIEKCYFCNQAFQRTPKNMPRVLYCGHNICSYCVKDELKKNNSLKCPFCSILYKKSDCAKFQINYCYLDLIEYLDHNFGIQLNQQIQMIGGLQQFNNSLANLNSNSDNFYLKDDELQKCKNSLCAKLSMYSFCSQDCKIHFQQVSTNKNQGNIFQKRKIGFMNDI